MRSGLAQKPQLSNDDFFDMLPKQVRTVIAHSPYPVMNCDWVYAVYRTSGLRAAIAEVEQDQETKVGLQAWRTYGEKHPQARPPFKAPQKRNA